MDVMTLAAKLTLNTSEFNTGLTQSENKFRGLTSGGVALGNLMSRAAEKAGRAVVAFGKQTVQVGMDFDAQMSQVKALGQLEDDNFFRIRERAMRLGETTKFTATQVAEAFSYMALAGWDTQEMLDGIDGVLNLAAASGEDLGRTSDIVTDALTALGLEAKDSSHFVDVLAAASANSNTSVAQMGEAFKYLATTGGVMKYSIDDIAMTLGLLANNGIKATRAGTSMRQILSTLINPTEDAADAMSKLGISLFDPKTNARKPLGQVLKEFRQVFKDAGLQLEEGFDEGELQDRLDKLNAWYDEEYEKIGQMSSGKTKAKKQLDKEYNERFAEEITPNQAFLQKLGDIGGLRGISSLFAIMNSSDKDFYQLLDAISESEGAAETMSKEMLNNLAGDVTLMKSALEGLQLVINDSLNEDFRNFIKLITAEIGKFNEAFKEEGFSGLISTLVGDLGQAIGSVLSDPKTWTTVINTLASLGEGLLDGLLGKDLTNAIRRFFGVEVEGQLNKDARSGIQGIFESALKAEDPNQAASIWNDFMKDVFNASGYDPSLYNDFMDKFDFDTLSDKFYDTDDFVGFFNQLFKDIENFGGDVKPKPDVSLITAELAKKYTATVTLIPDSSLMPEGSGYDDSNAKGNWDVPYDNFLANLHRGEMVLTASQARDYRAGNGGSGVDYGHLEDRIAAAIRTGMEGATVRSYLNGRDITQEVNRNNMNGVKGRRFAG